MFTQSVLGDQNHCESSCEWRKVITGVGEGMLIVHRGREWKCRYDGAISGIRTLVQIQL